MPAKKYIGSGIPNSDALADPGQRLRALRKIDNVKTDQEKAAEPVNKNTNRQRGEDRRDLDIGDQDAGDNPDEYGKGETERQRDRYGNRSFHQMESPGDRHGHERNQGKIDPAPNNGKRHRHAQYAEDRHIANKRQDILG